MADELAFLHTAHVHVGTFGKLMAELAPDVTVRHIVREDLLRDAQQEGADSPGLVRRIENAMRDAAGEGGTLVVCTCSTIGGAAESVDTGGRFTAMRVDREMADRAVRAGPRILVVAALQSTVGPTEALLRDSAARAGISIELRRLLIAEVWAHFVAGNLDRFAGAIASAVRANLRDAQVVVLAQASMAAALPQLHDLGVGVLCSPRLGAEAAASFLRRRHTA